MNKKIWEILSKVYGVTTNSAGKFIDIKTNQVLWTEDVIDILKGLIQDAQSAKNGLLKHL